MSKKVNLRCNRSQMQKRIDDLVKQTHFNKSEVETLIKKYNALCNNKPLDRTQFRDVLQREFQMTDDIIMDRVFRAFDKDSDGKISTEEFVRGMSVFLRGTLEERVDFCFCVYDLHSDGHITKEEMFPLLKDCLYTRAPEEDPDESSRDLVDLAHKKLAKSDIKVSPDDYLKAVLIDDLVLEFFGQCMPCETKESVWFMERVMAEYGARR